jgi:DNA-binding transcriptional ArsR family regulator
MFLALLLPVSAMPDLSDGNPPEAPVAPQGVPVAPQGAAPQVPAAVVNTASDVRAEAERVHNGLRHGQGSPTPRPQPGADPLGALPMLDERLQTLRSLIPADLIGYAQAKAEEAKRLPAELLAPSQPQAAEQGPVAPQTVVSQPEEATALAPILIAAGAATAATLIGFWIAGGSTLGGKAAAGAASEFRRILPFASPLFTRFERDTVLGHPRREALYGLIMQEPGISLQALGDRTNLSRTAAIHHLRLLEQQHLIVSRRVGRSRHYYENGGRYGHDQKEAYAVLQNPRTRAVAEYIQGRPGVVQKDLCEALSIQPSIAHWHVRRLAEAHIVEAVRQGRTVAYFPGPGQVAMRREAAPPAGVTA